MEKIALILTAVVSLIALLFGGLLNYEWEREVNSAKISVFVNSISYGVRKVSARPIVVPDNLVEQTTAARFFPSLKPRMSRTELDELLTEVRTEDYDEVALELTLANSELKQGDLSDNHVRDVWNNISKNSKATMFAMRTIRRTEEKIRKLFYDSSEENIPDLLERWEKIIRSDNLNTEDSEFAEQFNQPEIQSAFIEVIRETNELERRPNKDQILEILETEIPFLQAAGAEYDKFSKEVERLISEADNAAQNAPRYWDVSVTIFNTGGNPGSIMSAGFLVVQREAANNTIVFLSPFENSGNIVIEPGKAKTVLFRSSEDNNADIVNRLIDSFNSEEKDFRVLFSTLDGNPVVSERSNFSAGVAETQRESMAKIAEKIEI